MIALDLPQKVDYICSKDYVTFYKKKSTDTLSSVCGNLSDIQVKEFVINYHIMVINFSTDLLYTGRGFKLSFKQGKFQIYNQQVAQ